MADLTINYMLSKPAYTDKADVNVFNANADIIDAKMKEIADAGTAIATTAVNGLMSAADKTKLNGIATSANNYVHPTGDGNLHVPATGTANSGKVLTAGTTAGSLSWATPAASGSGATVFNVKSYGAVGNGTTNDTTAFQNTMNAIATAGGGTMYVPSGTYLITSTLQYVKKGYAGITIIGDGNTPQAAYGWTGYGTLIQGRISVQSTYKTGSVPIFDFQGSHSVHLKNIRIEDSGTGGGTLTSIGVLSGITSDGHEAHQYNWENVTITLASKSGANTTTNTTLNSFGSVCVYSNGSELLSFSNCCFRSDVPMVLTYKNICGVTSPVGTHNTPNTCSRITIDKNCDLWSFGATGFPIDSKACSVFIDGGHDINIDAYCECQTANVYGFAIQSTNYLHNIRAFINVENSSTTSNRFHVYKAYSGCTMSAIDISATVWGNSTYPLFELSGGTIYNSKILGRSHLGPPTGQKLFSTGTLKGCLVCIDAAQTLGATSTDSTVLTG